MSDAVSICTADPLIRRVITDAAATYGLSVTFVTQTTDAATITISGPVRLGALLQRMGQRARKAGRQMRVLALGGYVFDPEDSVLISDDGDDVILTEKEAAILSCLAESQGGVVVRRDLLTKVWGYVEGVETHTLETHIYRLRQKLEVDPAKPEILLTEEQGYSLKF